MVAQFISFHTMTSKISSLGWEPWVVLVDIPNLEILIHFFFILIFADYKVPMVHLYIFSLKLGLVVRYYLRSITHKHFMDSGSLSPLLLLEMATFGAYRNITWITCFKSFPKINIFNQIIGYISFCPFNRFSYTVILVYYIRNFISGLRIFSYFQ